jgi:hypothetical protein
MEACTVKIPLASWKLGALALLLLVAAVGAYCGLLVRDVYNDATAGTAAMNDGVKLLTQRSLAELTPASLAQANASFDRADRSFAAARQRLGFLGDLIEAHGGRLPGSARKLQSVVQLLDLGTQVAAAASALGHGLTPAASLLYGDPTHATPGRAHSSQGILVRLTAALVAAQPAIATAREDLQKATATRRHLKGEPLFGSAATALAKLDKRLPQLSQDLQYLQGLPTLLGASGPRSYLIVNQDPTDLRATGGYMGSAALLILDHGKLQQIDYESTIGDLSYQSALQLSPRQTGPPPLPLLYYRALSTFQMRDANFWPDFPTSAAQIARLYTKGTGRVPDGVIAINPLTIAYLLRALGPMRVPGYPDVLTSANAVQRIEYYVHNRATAVADPHRKRFIVSVNHALLNTLFATHGAKLNAVLHAFERALADRTIMVVVRDPVFAGALHQAHWDGAVRTDAGDYLGVFDQNVTDSKLNGYIQEAINYAVTRRSDGRLNCRVTITYRNTTPHATIWISRTYYQDYLRVAVPGSVKVQERKGFSETFWPDEWERGRRLLTGGLWVGQLQTSSVSFTYSLPASVLPTATRYQLVVQKQSGNWPEWFTLQVTNGSHVWHAATWLTHDIRFAVPLDAPSGALTVQRGA